MVWSQYNPTWGCWSDAFLGSLPEDEGLRVRHRVVRGERPPTTGGGRTSQLRGGETHLSPAGAWPSSVPKWKLLPGSVDRVPGTCRRIRDAREVMVTAERVIGAWDVLRVDRQRLRQLPDRLGVVHVLRPGEVRCVKCDTGQKSKSWDHVRSPSIPAAHSSLRFRFPVQGDFTHLYRFTAEEFKSTTVTSTRYPTPTCSSWSHAEGIDRDFRFTACWNILIKPIMLDSCDGQ